MLLFAENCYFYYLLLLSSIIYIIQRFLFMGLMFLNIFIDYLSMSLIGSKYISIREIDILTNELWFFLVQDRRRVNIFCTIVFLFLINLNTVVIVTHK